MTGPAMSGNGFLQVKERLNMKWMQFLTPVKSKNYNETQQMISDHDPNEITILDVRQQGEYKDSHIPGAMLIPLPELSDRASELDPDKPTLVY
jgi:sulfur-carrier protein adenylyltransferase/sulfurtransferase